MRRRFALMMATVMALMPMTSGAKKKLPPPAVTIVCHREVKSPTGYTEVTRTLDANGRLIGVNATWVERMSMMPGDTALQAGWNATTGGELDLADGWLAVDFDTGSLDAKRSLGGKKYTVELSTSARLNQSGYHLRGRADRFDMFARAYPDVTLDWGDAAAMARGADRLFIVARDKNGKLLRSVEIDRAMFVRAVTDVAALAAQVRADATDPTKNCRLETETNDIII